MNTTTPVLRVEVPGQHAVVVEHHMPNDTYTVKYGTQFKRFKTLFGAITEYESCVIHAITCAGFE